MKERLIRLLEVLCFGIVLFGGAILLGYLYKKAYCEEVLAMAFIDQILMYVGAIMFGLIIFYVDVLPERMSYVLKLILSVSLLYIISLIYFSQTMINPLQNVSAFIAYTVWFILMMTFIGTIWFLYQMFLGHRYNKYLAKFQAELNQ